MGKMFHRIKHLFFWLSGAGAGTLEACPEWEQRKYVAFGATVLVPCAFAFIACSYALSTLTDNPRVIYPVAGVWSFIILTIDRALLAGYRPYLSVARKLSQFSLRLLVAILMGLSIAHPLVLLLFKDTVASVVEKDRAAEIETARAGFEKQKTGIRKEAAAIEESIADQRKKWNETFQAKFILQDSEDASAAIPGLTPAQQAELKKATDAATAPYRDRLAIIDKQIAELTPQSIKVQTELSYWNYEFDPQNNLSFREEFYNDMQGQRTGYKTRYYSVGLGYQHWFGPQIEVRPEVVYYHSLDAKAFNNNNFIGDTSQGKNYQLLISGDIIIHW